MALSSLAHPRFLRRGKPWLCTFWTIWIQKWARCARPWTLLPQPPERPFGPIATLRCAAPCSTPINFLAAIPGRQQTARPQPRAHRTRLHNRKRARRTLCKRIPGGYSMDEITNMPSAQLAGKSRPPRRALLDLAPLELDCLNTLWPMGEGTVREIRDRLAERLPRAYTTIMTIMDRLARKGIVERRKTGSRLHLSRQSHCRGRSRASLGACGR